MLPGRSPACGTGAGYVALLLLTYRHLHTSWAISVVLLGEWIPAMSSARGRAPRGSPLAAPADRRGERAPGGRLGGLVLSHTAVPIVGLALLAGVGNSLQRPALRSALPVVAGDARQLAAAWYDSCRWIGLISARCSPAFCSRSRASRSRSRSTPRAF